MCYFFVFFNFYNKITPKKTFNMIIRKVGGYKDMETLI